MLILFYISLFDAKTVSSEAPEVIEMVKAIEHWNQFTCLNFRWATSDDVNRVKLQNGPMCGAQVGMVGGEQALFLGRGCGVVNDIFN